MRMFAEELNMPKHYKARVGVEFPGGTQIAGTLIGVRELEDGRVELTYPDADFTSIVISGTHSVYVSWPGQPWKDMGLSEEMYRKIFDPTSVSKEMIARIMRGGEDA